jgi:hypothetical protein
MVYWYNSINFPVCSQNLFLTVQFKWLQNPTIKQLFSHLIHSYEAVSNKIGKNSSQNQWYPYVADTRLVLWEINERFTTELSLWLPDKGSSVVWIFFKRMIITEYLEEFWNNVNSKRPVTDSVKSRGKVQP